MMKRIKDDSSCSFVVNGHSIHTGYLSCMTVEIRYYFIEISFLTPTRGTICESELAHLS